MRVLYFDCFSGISGDMTLGALVDAGANPKKIEKGLEQLLGQRVQLTFEPVVKKGVSAKKLRIYIGDQEVVDGQAHGHSHGEGHSHSHEHGHGEGHSHSHEHGHGEGHSHSHEHSHGEGHSHDHEHSHGEGHSHDHEHSHGEGHSHDHSHSHGHEHRHYSDIVRMIEKAEFSPYIEKKSLAIFKEIGLAESKIHNIPLDHVHFHEVGALDSIVDIVGACLALEDLEIERIFASAVAVGNGYIKCDHGIYPIPAPATLEMMKDIPIRYTEEKGELTTPTGAGILAALVDQFCPMPPFTVKQIGYGAGSKDLAQQPNVLRVVIGEME
ncbi:nickel insertion protein [Ammoniphilus resinae]|uniref:Uncharacterized protein (DUF111 family) n=1 Tax=Ammoniphilus resinae TaxID=861532 RepID=A0ABS4GUK3_9BACL|nr:uncharacterized protein (DUF111 family) [Ammoniphilus resinae]